MNILLLCNRERPGEREVMLESAAILKDHGAFLYSAADEGVDYIERINPEEGIKVADALVVVGGDGSILSAASLASKYEVPILGINMGRLGFLSELEPEEIDLLSCLMKGKYTIERRMMLEASIVRSGETVYTGHGLNDAVLTRGVGCKVMEFDIYADSQFIAKFRADGVIISTPTGSTGYSMSAGGPIIDPTEHNLTATPICAHGLYAKSFVLASERVVTVGVRSLRSKSSVLSVDGRDDFPVLDDDLIVIKQSPFVTDMIKVKGGSVYDVIRDKFNYGI